MDVYPDVAGDLGFVRRGSWIYHIADTLLNFPRKRADLVIVLGECMRDRLLAKGVEATRIAVCENWSHSNGPQPWPRTDVLSVLYSGNFGRAHDAATIQGVLKILCRDSAYEFIFAGGGPKRKALEAVCAEMRSGIVRLRGYTDRDKLMKCLGESHIGLVTQLPETCGSVVPSKTYGIMAAGRPVLYIGPKAATPARVIERFNCGWHFECGDVDGVVALLRRLQQNPEEAREAGERAYQAYLEHYTVEKGTARILRAMGIEPAPQTQS